MPISPLASLRGATRPRVRLAPDSVYSFGPETTELSRRAGLSLDEWQADGVDIILSVRADGKWACFEYCEWCSRQNGKTVGIFTPRALAGMFLTGEPLVTWSAHEYKTAMEGFRAYKICLLTLGKEVRPNVIRIENDPEPILVKVVNTNGEESFERVDTGQRVKFIARSKGSGRGFGASNLIDEAFAYTRIHQDAIMPTILAQENPQIGYASSPPLTGDTGEVMYSLRSRAENGEIGALGYRDWGLGGDLDHLVDIDLDDRANWRATNPATSSGRLTEEKIRHLRNSMSDEGFAREVLGVWPVEIRTGGGVIDPKAWAELADPDSQIEGSMVFALDASPGLRSGAIAVAGHRGDGIPHVEITGRDGLLDHRRGVDWLVPRARELEEQWQPEAWLVAPDGPAGALLEDLRAVGIEPKLISTRELAQACGSLVADVVDPERDKLRHLGQPALHAAVAAVRKRDIGDGAYAFGRRVSEDDISPAIAAAEAVHGLAVYGGMDPAANVW